MTYGKTFTTNLKNMRLVSTVWLAACLIGSIPYLATGFVTSFFDALFLSVSAFTTTGAELGKTMPVELLIYFSSCQWVGGFAILVFLNSLLPPFEGSTIAGASTKQTGRSFKEMIFSRDALALMVIYAALSALMFLILQLCGYDSRDALLFTLTTCSTGGVGNASISGAGSGSGASVICFIFMVLSSISFPLYASAARRRFDLIKKNTELNTYIVLVLSSGLLIFVFNLLYGVSGNIRSLISGSFFSAVSFSSTTGLTNTNIAGWPAISKLILCLLSFFGASSASTGSGIKLIRIIIVFRAVKRAFFKRIHPSAVISIRANGKPVSEDSCDLASSFVIHYVLIFLAGAFMLSFSSPDMETAFFGSAALLNNTGASFGAIGGSCDYSFLNVWGKLWACFLMLAGRLEIYALLLPFARDHHK